MSKIRNALFFLLLTVFLAGSAVSVRAAGGSRFELTDARNMAGMPSAPSISSRSAFVIELNSGEVIFAKNENEDRYPASITKVMTALVVIENCDLEEEVTFSKASVTDIEDGGHNWSFKEGEVLTVEQCLYGLMLNSVNECAYALAEHVGGSIEGFAAMMNEKAAELGCTNTHFVNPHGLNDPEHITTAHDMGLIFWAALENETFYTIDSTVSYKIPPTQKNPDGYSFTMHHKMMLKDSGYYNETVKAGKTGYTSLAKHTLVTYAQSGDARLAVICMKEGTDGATIYEDTKKLINYGFDNFSLKDLNAQMNAVAFGINGASPLPVKTGDSLFVYVPSKYENVSASFEPGADGSLGTVSVKSDTATILEKTLSEDSEILAGTLNTQEKTDTKESEERTSGSEETQKGTSFFSVLLKIIIIIVFTVIGLVFIYWVVIQFIKRRRMRLRREQAIRKARIQRIRRLREQERRAAEDFDV